MKRGVHHQRIATRGIEPRFADPLWDEQWYLVSLTSQKFLGEFWPHAFIVPAILCIFPFFNFC